MRSLEILLALISVLVVNGQEKRAESKHNQKNSQGQSCITAQPSPPSAPWCSVIKQTTPQTVRNSSPDDAIEYLSRLLAPEIAPTLGLFLIGTVGTIVAICTLRTLKNQTQQLVIATVAAKKSANAAWLNAQAVINAERPWFLISIKPDEKKTGLFVVECFNAGRTPGIIDSGECHIEVHPADFVPPEKLSEPFILPQRDLLVSKDSFPIREVRPDSVQVPIGGREVSVFVYGQIRYRDVIHKGSDEPLHETWWCFIYLGNGKFGRAGGAYPKHT